MSMREPMRILAAFLAAAFLLGALSGCTSDREELETWIAAKKKRPGGPIEPLPEVKPYEAFAYNAATVRSPFAPGAPAAVAGGVRPDSRRNREFLE